MTSKEFDIDYYSPYFMIKVEKEEFEILDSSISLKITENLDAPSMLSITIDNTSKFDNYSLKDIDNILDTFKEGNKIESHIGYFNDSDKLKTPYFSGKIVGVSPSFSSGGIASLSIESYDNLHFLKKNMPKSASENRIYKNEKHGGIIEKIMKRNGLKGTVDLGPFKKKTVTQQVGFSDYALLDMLTKEIGYEYFLRDGKLNFRKPGDFKNKKEDLILEWGKNLISFSPRLSTANIIEKLTVKGSNTTNPKKPIKITVSTESNEITALKEKSEIEYSFPVENDEEAKSVAETLLFKHNSNFIEGTGECIGNPKLRPGMNIKIQGIGEKFSGIYYVKNVTQSISKDYKVSFGVRRGLSGNI